MRINRGFTRWWDARNAFRGAGSAVMALCFQCPVWRVDPAIQVRPRLLPLQANWPAASAACLQQLMIGGALGP